MICESTATKPPRKKEIQMEIKFHASFFSEVEIFESRFNFSLAKHRIINGAQTHTYEQEP